MTKDIPAEMFKPLELTRKDVPDGALTKYRVFTNDTSYVTVEAADAQSALEKSGITQAYRVEYDSIRLKTII